MANNRIDMTVGLKVDKSGLTQLKKSLQDIQNLTTRDLMNINGNNFNKAKEDLKTVKSQAEKVEAALKQAFNPKLGTVNVETFNNVLKKSSGSIETIYSNFKKAGASGEAAFRNMASQLAKVQTQVKQTHGWLDKMAITFANTIKWNISSSVFNSLTGSIQQAWNFTKALDSSLNDIRIVTGKSADEMDRFAVKANAAAKELGATTKDYTNASLIFAQQGLSDKEIEAKTNVTLKVANVTGQDAAAVSEQLTAVWNGYKVSAEEAEIYADRLAAVASKSASNLQELATGMSKVASAAATMGVSEEQLAAQLSTIISVTRQAPESVGVALKTVYARMSDIKAGLDEDGVSLGNYSGKMAAFGINVLDMSGNLRDMGEVIEEIGEKWGTMTRQQQVSLAQTMGGQRQYSNLVALFDNFDKYQNMVSVAQNAEGTLEKQNETHMDRLTTHITQMTAATEKLFMTLVDSDGFKDLIDIFTQLIELTSGLVDSIGGLGPILGVLGGIGAKTFGTDIAKSLTETITNLKRGKQEAEDFSEQIKALQEMKNVKGISEESKQYIEAQQNRLKQMPSMTEEQRAEITKKIEELNAKVTTLQGLEEQKQNIDQTLKSLGEIDGKIMGFSDLSEEDSTSKLQEALEKKEKAYKDFFEKIKKLSEETRQAFENTDYSEGQIDVAEQRMKALKVAIQEAKHSSDMDSEEFKGYLKEIENSLKDYEAKINRVKSALQANSLDPTAFDVDIIKQENLPDILQIEGTFEGFIEKIKRRIAQVKEQFSEMAPDFAEELQNGIKKAKAGVEGTAENVDAFLEKIDTQKAVQGFIDMAGGVSQVYGAMQSIANLGNIWASNDSGGQKFLKTITTLAAALPSMWAGLKSVSKGIDALNKARKISAATAATNAVAQGAEAASTAATGTAAAGATPAVHGLNAALTALSINPVTAAIGAIAIAIAGVMLAFNAYQENLQKTIEKNKELIQSEREKQKELDSELDFADKVQELNEQYKQGLITRAELKKSIVDLGNQYGLENEAIKQLISNTDRLTEAIKKQRLEKLKEKAESSDEQWDKSQQNIMNEAHNGAGYRKWFGTGDFVLQDVAGFHFAGIEGQDSDKLRQIYQSNIDAYTEGIGGLAILDPDAVTDNLAGLETQYKFEFQNTKENQYTFFKQVQKANKEAEKQGLETLQRLKQYEDRMAPIFASMEETAKNRVQTYGDLALAEEDIQFNNVDSVIDYINGKDIVQKKVSDALSGMGFNDQQINDFINDYFSKNFSSSFANFEEGSQLYKNTVEKFGKVVEKEDIDTIFSNLNSDQLKALTQLLPKDKKDLTWDDLSTVAKAVSKKDFSNVKDIYTGYSDDVGQSAYQKYSTVQEIEDQVNKGKNISKKQFEELNQISDQFAKDFIYDLKSGTYKFIGSAQEFNKAADLLKTQDMGQAIATINEQINGLETIAQFKPDKNGATTSGYTYDDLAETSADQALKNTELQKAQLAYLDAIATKNSALQIKADTWKDILQKNGSLSKQQLENVIQEIGKVGDKTKDLDEQYLHLIEQKNRLYYQYNQAIDTLDPDVKEQDFKTLTQYLLDTDKRFQDNTKSMEENRLAAEDLAQSILRFDSAIESIKKNYSNWMKALNSDNIEDKAKAFSEMRNAYGDLLDIDGSQLSADFLSDTENLKLMKQAINGNEQAYDKLLGKVQNSVFSGDEWTEGFKNSKNIIEDMKEGLPQVTSELDNLIKKSDEDIKDIKVGAVLDDSSYIDTLNKMIAATGWGTDQVAKYFQDLGYDAELEEVTTTEKPQQEYHNVQPKVEWEKSTNPGGPNPIGLEGMSNTSYYFPKVTYEETAPTVTTDEKQTSATAVRVKSLKKKAGGNIKYNHSNKGAGTGGKSKSKGGGGKKGGSGNKTDKSQKDTKKTDKKQQDIYHDINIELKDINRALERTQKTQEKLYGKELLDNLQKQSDLLDEHIKKLREKEALQKVDLKNKQAELKTLGMTFDEYGHITNYLEKLIAHQNKINKLTEEYNAIVKKYNASTNKSTKEKLNQQMTAKDKQIKQAEEAKKETEEKIKDYEELQDEREELLDQIEEELNKQTEIAIKKFRMQLEVRLETGDAEREWNDFKRNVLNADDVLKTSSFSTIMRDAQKSLEDFGSYFDVAGAKGSIAILTEQIKATKQQIEDIDKLGESAIYGKNKAQAMEDLKTDLSDLMSKLGEVQELIKALDQAYLDGMADIKEQYSNRQEQLSFIGELVQHDMDLLGIIFGSKNYAAMQKYYEALRQNQLGQISLLKEESNYWKSKWEQALQNGNVNAAKQFENNYKETLNNINSLIDTAAQTIKDKYLNAIDAIFDQINNKLTNEKGLDYLNLEWDLINKNAESYLDKINSAYAIQDFQNKSTKAINDAKGLKSQQALKKVSEEQLKILRNKDKLTQYDVDRANKILELEKARLALEEARQNKTSLRLKRDAQGNYSYQYVSDNNKILEAQETVAKAQNELFNFDAQQYKDNLKEFSEAWKEYQEKVRNILQDETLSEQERNDQLKLARDEYETYITNKLKENLSIRQNLMQSAFDEYSTLYNLDAQKFANMSAAEKDVIMNQLVPQWDSGIADMINRLNGDGEQQGLTQVWEDTFEQIKNKGQEFKQEQAELFKEAGINPEDLQNTFNPIVDIYSDLIGTNEEFLNQLDKEKSALENIVSQAEKFKEQYKGIFEYAKKSAEEAQKFRTEQEKAAAAAAQAADKTRSKANAQADTKAAQQKAQQTVEKGTSTSVSKASMDNSSNNGGTKKRQDDDSSGLKEDKVFTKIQQLEDLIQKKKTELKNQAKVYSKNGIPMGAFLSSSKRTTLLSQVGKLKKEIDSKVKKVQRTNSKSAQEYQKKAATTIAEMKKIGSSEFSSGTFSGTASNLPKSAVKWNGMKTGSGKQIFFRYNQRGNCLYYAAELKNGKYVNARSLNTARDGWGPPAKVDKKRFQKFNTGGYTGDWADQQGRLALLHKKELVLNAKDTENMLDMVTISKKTLNGLRSKSSLSLSKLSKTLDFNAGTIEQNVHITASFPNVNSKREIEQAFNDLINLAAQRAMKRI